MKRLLALVFGFALLCLVALIAAFSTMRLSIHGREVDVPNLANLSDTDAANAARKLGLNLSVENRFFSAGIAPNHVLSQSPAAGSLVRRGGQVRVTESLGGQRTPIPDVAGQAERPATLVLSRLQLEVGPAAHLPAPGPPGYVLAQSPPANTRDLTAPRVSVLLSAPETDAPTQSYVMPLITGDTIAAANSRLSAVGLHIASATDPSYVPPPPAVPDAGADPAIAPDVSAAPPPVNSGAIIAYQSPAAGHRVSRSDAIRVTIRPTVNPDTLTTAPPPL